MLKRIYPGIVLVFGLLIMPSPVLGQLSPAQRPQEFVHTRPFFFEAIAYASDDSSSARIDFYLQVPYPEVRFTKEIDHFIARYEVSISLQEIDKKTIKEISWVDEIRVADFAATTSPRQNKLTQRDVNVPPGNYRLDVRFLDLESQKSSSVLRSLRVTDFWKNSLSLSDIMVVSRLSTDGSRINVVPNISTNVANHTEGFFLFFEIYSALGSDSVRLVSKILNSKDNVIFETSQIEALKGYRTQTFVRISDYNPLPGNYKALIVAELTVAGDKVHTASTSKEFVVKPADLPVTVSDLEKAIDQLIYIARPSEMDYMREKVDPEQKKQRFLDFWKKRDPDPSTARNELMEEYYDRIEYANKNFSHYMEGWRTDMGMVFIRFGRPDHVDRQPFSQNAKPYEIWYYYQVSREFVFVDETGFGDYRLRYPTTDLWGRIR